MLKAPVQELTLGVGALAEARPPAPTPTAGRVATVELARWVARAGRVAVVWLPVWAVCLASLPSGPDAFVASIAFTAVWVLALRRSFADVNVTVWTIGAVVPATVGAAFGALLVLPASVAVRGLHVSTVAVAEMAIAVLVAAAVWETFVATSLAAKRRILLVGTAGGGTELLWDVRVSRRAPFDVVGVVDDDRTSAHVAGIPRRGPISALAEIVEEERPELVVLADPASRDEALDRLIEVGGFDFAVADLPEFYEYAFGRLPVQSLTPEWFMCILHLYRRPYSRVTKRMFDLVVSLAALVLVAPLLPLIALLVRLTGGPVFFHQTRLGECGKPFTIHKFRTMRCDAEPEGAVWAAVRDTRATGIGRVLRKTHLDELPQLWNVLKGEMSIVGPRPERPEFAETLKLGTPFWTQRHLVKPGITGWAQISRGYTADAAGTRDKLSYDLWYLRHRSLTVDVAICARTVATVLTGYGAR